MPDLPNIDEIAGLDEEILRQMEAQGRALKVTGSCRFTEAGIHVTVDAGTIRGDLFVDKDEFTGEHGATRVLGFIDSLPRLFTESLTQIGVEIVEENGEPTDT